MSISPPPAKLKDHNELIEWYRQPENKLMYKNQFALMRHRFLELREAFKELTRE